MRAAWTERRAWVVAVAIGAQLLLCAVLAADNWFASDDFVWFSSSELTPTPTPGWLRREVFDHFSPGHRLANWTLQHVAPLSWTAALATMLALVGAVLVLLVRIADLVVGRTPWTLPATAAFGTSIAVFGVLEWWASALVTLPVAVLTLLAVERYLAHRETGARGALAVAVLATVVGLLFYEKAVLVPLYCLLVRVLLLPDARGVLREWRTFVVLSVVPALFVVLYLLDGSYGTKTDLPELTAFSQYARITWLRAFTPGVLGFRVPPGGQTSLELATIPLSQVLFLGLVGWTLWRSRGRAWRAWALLVVVLALNTLLVGLPRVPLYGPSIGYELRYLVEAAFVLPLVLLVAVKAGGPVRRPRVGAAVVVVALVAHVAAVAVTVPDMRDDWVGDDAKAYTTNLRADLDRLGPVDLLETAIPGWLMPANQGAFTTSDFVRTFNREVRYPPVRSREDVRYVVAGDGRVQRSTYVAHAPVVPDPPVQWLRADPAQPPARVREVPGGVCLRTGDHALIVERRWPATLTLGGPALLVVDRLRSGTPISANVFLDRGMGYPGAPDRALRLDGAKGATAVVEVGVPFMAAWRIDLAPGVEACLRLPELGFLAPAA